MPNRLPPLTALRAFDAAARHMSFAKAAEELNVTPAALSFQIKSLEANLGQPLFNRLNRSVELTELGKVLAPGVAEGFQALGVAWQQTRRAQDSTTLTVTAGPAFTAKWLAPRLFEFARHHPDIDLRFSAGLSFADLRRDGVDVAIRFGTSSDASLVSHPAPLEWVTPVMTPEMAQEFKTPESLLSAPLIYDQSLHFLKPPCDWTDWFRNLDLVFEPGSGPQFSNADHAIDAACAGLGVALGRRSIIIKDVQEGRLVAPFKIALQSEARFQFVYLPESAARPQISAFRDWFFTEIDKTLPMWDEFKIISAADTGHS